MLKLEFKSLSALLLFIALLLFDFTANVWVPLDTNEDILKAEDRKLLVLRPISEIDVPSIDSMFGLEVLVEPDEAQLLEQQLAEQTERELLEQEQRELKVLSIGKDDIRLFGISLTSSTETAMLSINFGDNDSQLLNLVLREKFTLMDGEIELMIEEINRDAIKLSVLNTKTNNKTSFHLVIFNYEF